MSCTYKYQGKEYLESELSDLISSIDKGTIFKQLDKPWVMYHE